MKSRELANLGVPKPALKAAALAAREALAAGKSKAELRALLPRLVKAPADFREDPQLGALALLLLDEKPAFVPRDRPASWRQWGQDLDPQSVEQMRRACELPVTVRGALMPDAHLGYGLPIGGVLATRDAVIPYAVGVDIACRVKLTVLDLGAKALEGQKDRLERALEEETRFGLGASFRKRREHEVLDRDWTVTEVTRRVKDKAWSQLGSSGSGNHFVEFGLLELDEPQLGLEAGSYLALLSHSGSRGAGSAVAGHYSRLARERHPELPKELGHLAWLELSTQEGQEYWEAMELMGHYAEANHALIHRHLARRLGGKVLLDLENHHNFAWKEVHEGEELVVHRKGATPAGEGVLGIIPGSMASATYIVRGKGESSSLMSSSHGAGRLMSRARAKSTFTWSGTHKLLAQRGVTLLSAGLDEVPMVYKDIEEVMAAQADLVEPLARFWPRIVKMAPPGEKPED